MRTDRRIFLSAAALGFALAFLPPAHAQNGGYVIESPMLDPWVPPSLSKESVPRAKATSGAELQAQVDAKLRARFLAAAGPDGRLTKQQAAAAGLGGIANRFEAIDRRGAGAITFDDYRAYLRVRP